MDPSIIAPQLVPAETRQVVQENSPKHCLNTSKMPVQQSAKNKPRETRNERTPTENNLGAAQYSKWSHTRRTPLEHSSRVGLQALLQARFAYIYSRSRRKVFDGIFKIGEEAQQTVLVLQGQCTLWGRLPSCNNERGTHYEKIAGGRRAGPQQGVWSRSSSKSAQLGASLFLNQIFAAGSPSQGWIIFKFYASRSAAVSPGSHSRGIVLK